MSWTQVISIAACGVLGYWLVAVFLPLLAKSREDYTESPTPGADSARGSAEDVGPETDRTGPAVPLRWFEVLEVREDCATAELVAAYRQKISQYHPDRVAQMGPDIRQLAERRSIEINRAYDSALRARPH